MVSLNVPNSTIDVSAENLVRLDRVASQQGLPLEVCRNADGSATLTNIQVLWHTLGDTGLVELWSESSDPRTYDESHRPQFQTSPYEKIFRVLGTTGLRVPLKNSGLQVRTGSNLHCLELSGLHFESNSAVLSEDAKKDLAQQLAALRDSLTANKAKDGKVVEQAARFEIVGHADPRKRQNGTNEELASKRAEAVRDMVEVWVKDNAPQWSKATIRFRSEGAREQARKCDAMTGTESEACNAFNRRVVLRLTTVGPS
ncbi:outer membrane protein OmpA-like peptidoglycan-associated protein [Pelomonas aquatica]|uniref:Outer membrane protein OmpA-like peptidoglycan-associated protein n=1 Tax=Pelomonas aquatica TaxID=431058 RepID=A0ABU1ZFS4_9BURK|nr:outer membrane protein OmpA-like peptidoglycan-associated protein [Pelomonas aquatica]